MLSFLRKKNKHVKFFFLMGADNLINFHKWHNWKKITKLAKIIVFARPGFSSKALSSVTAKKLDKQDWFYIKTTKLNIFIYSLILFPTVLSPYFLNFLGLFYFVFATAMSAYYLFISFKLLKEKNSSTEKKLATHLFGYSILYLFMIFVLILIDKAI